MLYSMTGFGKAVTELPGKKITVELKSLNSKQIDVAARVPSSLRAEELAMRNLIAASLERGKVDLTIYVESVSSEASVRLNVPALKAYKADVEQAAAELGIDSPADWYTVLMRFPDVIKSETPTQADDNEVEAVMAALSDAIEALMSYRRAEGEKLETFFAERIARIRELLEQVPQYETERVERIRTRMEEGLAKIHNVDYDRSRLEQELFFYIEKLDVNEEKQRLTQHLNYFTETLEAPRGQGKKLGFIAQEMGREINTLGSKSNHAQMQRLVVQMKDVLEQIKEQVLNVM
ncbi:MAG: YicC family protein [Duncaniella sp.]|uniref:YicC/YloC family endoribonuclease n=1 Tax=Duncaniella sp. TaxID=2518496 RepID=UPI0023C744AE|nr:YicC/YloC family endoribonuclease [Duncaniella sp.]MDE5989724.1 YicC family protein [Duncaniella sp.]